MYMYTDGQKGGRARGISEVREHAIYFCDCSIEQFIFRESVYLKVRAWS